MGAPQTVFDPSRWVGDKYSPNLKSWLLRHAKRYGHPTVFKDAFGFRWIGWLNDDWLHGCRLSRVLSAGARATVYAWPHPKITPEIDFWEVYEKIGRCAIDGQHATDFIGSETRWATDGDVRSCLWCGEHTQVLRRWTEVRERERWEPSTHPAAASSADPSSGIASAPAGDAPARAGDGK